MEKRQKIREKRHEAYLRRKSTGWQATYYWKNKRARKEKMDAAKEAIRAEDQAKGIYYHPKQRKEQKDEEELIAMGRMMKTDWITAVCGSQSIDDSRHSTVMRE